MGKPRVNQFAEDLGISRSEAMKLINAGRNRRDGGSTVLENSMSKMKSYKNGGVGPTPRPNPGDLNESMGRMITTVEQEGPTPRPQKGPKPRPKNLKAARLASEAKKTARVLKKTAKAGLSIPTDIVSALMGKEPTAMIKAAKELEKEVPKMKEGGRVKRRGDDRPVIMAKDGVYNDMGGVSRGGGAAIRGTKFTGVK